MPIVQRLRTIARIARRASYRKPLIAVVPSFDEGDFLPKFAPSIYMRRSYNDMLCSVGALPFIITPEMDIDEIISRCDGLIISGGEDIPPKFYGQELYDVPGSHREPDGRVEWQFELMRAADNAHMPVLGICHGMQFLNVYYGGTLIQDLDTFAPDNIGHKGTMHEIQFTRDMLGFATGAEWTINSRHHQAVDRLGDGFEVAAIASDGVVEAICHPDHRYGIQWHPESDVTGAHIYRAFVEICAPQLR